MEYLLYALGIAILLECVLLAFVFYQLDKITHKSVAVKETPKEEGIKPGLYVPQMDPDTKKERMVLVEDLRYPKTPPQDKPEMTDTDIEQLRARSRFARVTNDRTA